MELHKNLSADPTGAAAASNVASSASAANGSAGLMIKNETGPSGSKPLSQMMAANRVKGPAEIALANLSKTVGGALLAKSVKNVRKFAPY